MSRRLDIAAPPRIRIPGHRVFAVLALGVAFLGAPSSLWAQPPPEAVEYYATDALGSIRVVFDANGAVLHRMDYGPFGQELFASSGTQENVYAGIFRDSETEQYYANARMYQNRTGRFNRPDPVYASLFEPQLWNRYAYSLNNPVTYSDPSGLCTTTYCEVVLGRGPLDIVILTKGGDFGGGGGQSGRGDNTSAGRSGRGSEQKPNPTGTTTTPTGPESGGETPSEDIPNNDPPILSACEEFSAGLAEIGVTTPFTRLGRTGDSLVNLALSNPFPAAGVDTSGFKSSLVDPGGQGIDVYKHVVGAAGTVLSAPRGLVLLGAEVLYDAAQWKLGHQQGPAEQAGNYAGARAGLYMVQASVTGNATAAKRNITTLLCR